jgi:molybdopterin synthase sulfur carrier subunit
MRVNLYADLRAVAGRKEFDVDLPAPATARAVLESVTADHPDLGQKIWQAPGQPFDHIHVFINGRQSAFLPQGLETGLTSSDTLDVFPPVGGGTCLAWVLTGKR